MQKLEITIVIPSIKNVDDCAIIDSFLASGIKEKLFPQFVFLCNPKIVDHNQKSCILSFNTHDFIFISNDRYVPSCEDNLFRTQDFSDVFKSRIVWIGEHDAFEWNNLYLALDFSIKNNVDMLAWNVAYSEYREDGAAAIRLSVPTLDDSSRSNQIVKEMFAGKVFDSAVGYASMISLYGPTDWAGFIGNHLYSREAYSRIMAYKFLEPFYSHVFKQILFAVEYPAKYAFFNAPVIIRLSDGFMKARAGIIPTGFLDRRAIGNSPSIGFGCLMHLYELEDDALFNLIANSLCVAIVPAENGELGYKRNPMLQHIMGFAIETIAHKMNGRSYYIENLGTSSLQDIRFVKLFLRRFVSVISDTPEIYETFDDTFVTSLAEAADLLTAYFYSMTDRKDLLKAAVDSLMKAATSLESTEVVAANTKSFSRFLQSRPSDRDFSPHR